MYLENEILRFRSGNRVAAVDRIARERALVLVLNRRCVARLNRTPGDDLFLAFGYLKGAGLISEPSEVHLFSIDELPGEDAPGADCMHLVTSSDSLPGEPDTEIDEGPCSGNLHRLKNDHHIVTVETTAVFPPESLAAASRSVMARQELFGQTGGAHAAAIFEPGGEVLFSAEDVGRCNALDKVIGWSMMEKVSLLDKGIIISGRLTAEPVRKAALAEVPIVCSFSAPSSLGIEIASGCGQALVGFMRDGEFNVYCSPGRVFADGQDHTS